MQNYLSATPSLPEKLRSEALTAVGKIVMADGKLSSEEKALLNRLKEAFNVSEEEINQALQAA